MHSFTWCRSVHSQLVVSSEGEAIDTSDVTLDGLIF